MNFHEMMGAFAERVNLKDVRTDDDEITLIIDEMKLVFVNEPDAGRMLVIGELGNPPPDGDDAFARMLLQANNLFNGTDGATFSQDAETETYNLCQRLALDGLDLEGFMTQVGAFVNTLETWRGVLADFRPVAEAVASDRAAHDQSEFPPFGERDFIRV